MPMIYVKTKPDRRAYFEGRVIPQDKFVPVVDTPYIRRLIDHWGDLEVEGGSGGKSSKTIQSGKPAAEQRPPSAHPAQPTQAAPNVPAPGTGAPKPTS